MMNPTYSVFITHTFSDPGACFTTPYFSQHGKIYRLCLQNKSFIFVWLTLEFSRDQYFMITTFLLHQQLILASVYESHCISNLSAVSQA